MIARFEQRQRNESETNAIRNKPELQFGAERFQVDLERQTQRGKRPLQAGAESG